ncbi:hypothetical protein HDK77DRAFT_480665 [Phyllosticta capitalensis]|uniref:Gfd2/YDR514C-like C-terminal domain-containing protein n=1 Tax=Phyllosticta capitalensis TaxID=121624 RepID=A0ABR1YW04_9PEZI
MKTSPIETLGSLKRILGFGAAHSPPPPEVFTGTRRSVILVFHGYKNDIAALEDIGFDIEHNGVVAIFDTKQLVANEDSCEHLRKNGSNQIGLSDLVNVLRFNPPIEKHRPRDAKWKTLIQYAHNAGVDAYYTMWALLGIGALDLGSATAGRAPSFLDNPPILVSFATENYEHDHSVLTEVGVSVLDLAQVRDIKLEENFLAWAAHAQHTFHWIVRENANNRTRNSDYCEDHRDDFPSWMGESATTPQGDIGDAVRNAIFAKTPLLCRPRRTTPLPTYTPMDNRALEVELGEEHKLKWARLGARHNDMESNAAVMDEGSAEIAEDEDYMAIACPDALRGSDCKLGFQLPSAGGPGVFRTHADRSDCTSLHICTDFIRGDCRHKRHHDDLLHFKYTCWSLRAKGGLFKKIPCNKGKDCKYGHDFPELRAYHEINREVLSKRRWEIHHKEVEGRSIDHSMPNHPAFAGP